MKLSEKAFLQQVKDLARAMGWFCYHTHDSRRSDPGFPDLVLTRYGRLIFAELKAENGKTSEAQIDWLGALELVARDASVVMVRLWRPSDWPEIEATLTGK